MDKIKLVVFNEYALGYIMPEQPDTVFTLADSVLRGAPIRTNTAPYYIGTGDTVRLAGKQDFGHSGLCSADMAIGKNTSLTTTNSK